MKPILRSFFTLFLTVFTSVPLMAMQAPAPSPLKATDYKLHFSPKDSPVNQIIAAINETPQGGLIAMNGSFINKADVVTALGHAQNRGVRLELCVDAGKSENKILLEQLAHDGLLATDCLHTKRSIFFDVDPRDDLQKAMQVRSIKVFTGSENLSGNVSTHHEYTFVSALPELVKRHYKDHLFNKTLCQLYTFQKNVTRTKADLSTKKDALLSPRAVRVYNSQKYDSGKLKANRIAKPVSVDAKESIWMTSMGFGDERVANALLAKARQGSEIILVVDKAAVKSNIGLRLLNALHQAGVKISVWMGSSLQHTKLLLRERRNKLDNHYLDSVCVLSTGNLVKNSSTEINYDQIIPDSHIVSQDIRAYFDTLIPQCTPFEKVDQPAIAQKKANKGKNLFSVVCGTCREVIDARAEVTLIKQLMTHCINQHQGFMHSSVALANVDKKTFYCGSCYDCLAPFYSKKSSASVTIAIAKHLEDHEMAKSAAEELRELMRVAKADLYIAKKETKKK